MSRLDRGLRDQGAVTLPRQCLDIIMPMHLIVSRTGHILHAGPTVQKLCRRDRLLGHRFLETFELRRPRSITLVKDLMAPTGTKLNLVLRDAPDIRLKGLALPMPSNGGVFVNLSFGISLPEAIRRFNLSASDFATTELTIEMLYLLEAKDAVTAESKALNMRLLGAKAHAEEQALSDTLTGLSNRRAMDVILSSYAASERQFALMQLDLDHFKEVNDTLGHAAGDSVLRHVADILLDEVRDTDSVIRLGGDEFLMILADMSSQEALTAITNRLLRRLDRPIPYKATTCTIAGSIGITLSADYPVIDIKQMLLDIDVALYASKRGGRRRATFVRDIGGIGQSADALKL